MKTTHEGMNIVKGSIGLRLSTIIERLSVSVKVKDIAKSLGVSVGTIYNIKNHGGDKCSLEMILTLADKMELDYIISIESKMGKKFYKANLEPIGPELYSKSNFAITLRNGLNNGFVKGAKQWH